MRYSNRMITLILITNCFLTGCAWFGMNKEKAINALQSNTQTTLSRVQGKIDNNPQSSLQETLASLDAILEYTKAVKNNSNQFSEEKILEYNAKIHIINENIDRFLDTTLLSDVSFPLGVYKLEDLSDAGKIESDKVIAKVLDLIQQLMLKYPQRKIKVTFKTTGYTDKTAFSSHTNLEKDILMGLDEALPRRSENRRAVYNKVLSRFRAASLNNYLKAQLQSKVKNMLVDVQIVTQNVGLGEALPSKKERTAYKPHDGRRRICIISPYVEVVL